MKIKTGMQAPDFMLPCHLGKDVTLGALRGKTVVLVFFPSPGPRSEQARSRRMKHCVKHSRD